MTLEVHVWSDVACPWCYVGKQRLSAAADACGVDLKLIWHAFELDPRPISAQKSSDYVERLATKYGRTRAQAQEMIDNMSRVGLEDGVHFDFARAKFANTFDAHRLLSWAHAKYPAKQNSLATALFDAHLCEGKDLNDAATLVQIAASADLDPDEASAVIFSDAFAKEVREDENSAREMGVTGVPFYVIGPYGVGGAQRPEMFEKVLRQALEEARKAPEPAFEEGALCGPEGC